MKWNELGKLSQKKAILYLSPYKKKILVTVDSLRGKTCLLKLRMLHTYIFTINVNAFPPAIF